jgi:hypothetical protein
MQIGTEIIGTHESPTGFYEWCFKSQNNSTPYDHDDSSDLQLWSGGAYRCFRACDLGEKEYIPDSL